MLCIGFVFMCVYEEKVVCRCCFFVFLVVLCWIVWLVWCVCVGG